jgi:hypothetical protein
MRYLVAT